MTDKNLELFKLKGSFTFRERKPITFRTERILSPINWVKQYIDKRIITKLEFNFHSGEQTLIQSANIGEGEIIQANLIGIVCAISTKSEYLEEIVINERSTLNEKATSIYPILNALTLCTNLTLITIKGNYLLSGAIIGIIIRVNPKLKEFRTKKCSIIPATPILLRNRGENRGIGNREQESRRLSPKQHLQIQSSREVRPPQQSGSRGREHK